MPIKRILLIILIITILLTLSCSSSKTQPSETTTTPLDQPTAECDLELARKFCPVIHLKGETEIIENFQPDSIELMVELSYLKHLDDPEFLIDPTLDDLYQYTQSDLYLDIAELDPEKNPLEDYMTAYLPVKAAYNPTVYTRITRDGDYTIVQYWLFYYFNDWRNYHEGDWELVQLNFPSYSSKELLERGDTPVFAGFSQHQAGQKMYWSDMQKQGSILYETHPLVYVAQGSHANYFKPGYYWSGLDFDDTGTSNWMIIHPDNIDVVLLEDEAQMESQEWLNFRGYWGEHSGFSFSVMELEFHQCGPFGPSWSEGGGSSKKWTEPAQWAEDLPEYPNPFWISFFHMIGDWLKDAIFSIFSPAEIHVYDAEGRHVGLDKDGNLEIEIPGAIYITPEGSDFKTILIPNAGIYDDYRVVIKGTDTGLLDLKALTPYGQESIKRFLEYYDVPVTATMIAELNIEPGPPMVSAPTDADTGIQTNTVRDLGTSLSIDSDGDGTFEAESKPGVFKAN